MNENLQGSEETVRALKMLVGSALTLAGFAGVIYTLGSPGTKSDGGFMVARLFLIPIGITMIIDATES